MFANLTSSVLIALLIYRKRNILKEQVKGHGNAWSSLFMRIVIFGVYRLVALACVHLFLRARGRRHLLTLLLLPCCRLNMALIIKPDEILLTGISKDPIFNGVIDFVQATSEPSGRLYFLSTDHGMPDGSSARCFHCLRDGKGQCISSHYAVYG